VAKDGGKAKKGGKEKKAKVYGPSTVLKPVVIGGFLLMLFSIVLPVVLG